jgi:quercetin dioxygenase-like cupin family protein
MKAFQYEKVEAKYAEGGASKTRVRWLITKEIGAENFAMRLFEMEPGGFSPLHTHPWEHEVFILDGGGSFFDGEKTTSIKANDAVFVPANEKHQFKNDSDKPLKFLCLIPYKER